MLNLRLFVYLAPKNITFQKVFNCDCGQQQVFEDSGLTDLLDQALEGYAVTSFAYGMTGSGKSHTMSGPEDNALSETTMGIIPRALRYLYSKISGTVNIQYEVRAGFLEIYNEQVS